MYSFMTKMTVCITKIAEDNFECQNILAGMMGQRHYKTKGELQEYMLKNKDILRFSLSDDILNEISNGNNLRQLIDREK